MHSLAKTLLVPSFGKQVGKTAQTAVQSGGGSGLAGLGTGGKAFLYHGLVYSVTCHFLHLGVLLLQSGNNVYTKRHSW